MVIVVLLGILIVVIVSVIAMYNRLVQLKNRVENAWSQIDVQLKRRADLIPNLVETVKGYTNHESETLTRLTEARAQMARGGGPKQMAEANSMLEGALKSLFAVVENYPDLKANQNFMMLQEELSATEGRIAYARQFYNDAVMSLNTKLETFPTNVIAGLFHFNEREYFEAEEADREVPKVQF